METKFPGGGSKRDQGESQTPNGDKKEFDLWRLLTTPEEMLEEEGAAPKQPTAAAPAVREPAPVGAPDAETIVYCRKHPEMLAISQCPVCAAYYCNECLIIKRGRLLCKSCAESLYAPSEAEVIEHGENAYQEHGDFLPEVPPEFNPSAFGIGSEGRLANVFKRVVSFVIDICAARLLYIVSYVILSLLLAGLSKGAVPSVLDLGKGNIIAGMKVVVYSVFHYHPLLLILFLDFLYFFISYSIANRTLGMSWLNMRIVSVYGDFVGIGSCALRSLILVVTLGFSIIIAFIHPRAMGLHDMAAGTYVINYSGIRRVDVYETVNVKLE
jgi:uncharacterized RDD family membrane protein YckC